MKKALILLVLFSSFSLFVNAQTDKKVTSYGEKITADNAIEMKELMTLLKSKDSLHTKLVGTVSSVCQKKGCWLTMDAGNGQSIMVRFYDYGFFLPMDCSGKKIVLEGSAYKSETTVDELRHYAEDAGKSKEEIEKIKEGKKEISFEATGVLLYN
ncbi:MAG: DUF4920 domain-containing protein [Bacteroidia bacterium]|nr:DUF4920 domain-containing protein [Bacteroidia bacterium]